MSIADRKPQPKKTNPNRLTFPSNSQQAAGWSAIVRFFKIDDEMHETYKYCRHVFDMIPGQGPWVDREGKTSERKGAQIAYCMGSPSNPYSQGADIELNEEGVSQCRSIILPNDVPLHDVDEGGEIHERCLAWCWTTNHLVIIDRKPSWFDTLFTWFHDSGGESPWYYDKTRPGYDVLLQTIPKSGQFYNYAFSSPAPNAARVFANIGPLIRQQRPEVLKDFNVVETREHIMDRLGIGGSGGTQPASAGAEFGDGSTPGSASRLDDGLDDSADMGDEL